MRLVKKYLKTRFNVPLRSSELSVRRIFLTQTHQRQNTSSHFLLFEIFISLFFAHVGHKGSPSPHKFYKQFDLSLSFSKDAALPVVIFTAWFFPWTPLSCSWLVGFAWWSTDRWRQVRQSFPPRLLPFSGIIFAGWPRVSVLLIMLVQKSLRRGSNIVWRHCLFFYAISFIQNSTLGGRSPSSEVRF